MEVVHEIHLLAKHYLKYTSYQIRTYLIFDLLALIPLQAINKYFWAFKLFRLVRLYRFTDLINNERFFCIVQSIFKKKLTSEKVDLQYTLIYAYKIIRLIVIDIIITYFLAIILYIVSNEFNYRDNKNTYLTNSSNELKKLSVPEQVLRCMYFTITTLATVGYGDYYPRTNIERMYIILVQLIGVSFYSYIMSNFIEVISSYERKVGIIDHDTELENWIAYLMRFNDNKYLDLNLVKEIENHFEYFWTEHKLGSISQTDSNLLVLPKSTQYFVF